MEKIDDQIISLLNERYLAARETAACLRELNLPVCDPASQQQVLER